MTPAKPRTPLIWLYTCPRCDGFGWLTTSDGFDGMIVRKCARCRGRGNVAHPSTGDEVESERGHSDLADDHFDLADDATADISDAEWDRVPGDLAENHDHYLYGAAKE